MLLKYAELPEPLVEWHQKHVVSVGSRPIRNGHPHPFARHQSANSNKNQCRQCSEHSEPVQPRVILRSCRHQNPKQSSKKNKRPNLLSTQAARNLSPEKRRGNFIVKKFTISPLAAFPTWLHPTSLRMQLAGQIASRRNYSVYNGVSNRLASVATVRSTNQS